MTKQKKKIRVPNDWIRGFSYKFDVDFNRAEMLEVECLSKEIYQMVALRSESPDGIDYIDGKRCPYYVRNGIKMIKMGDKYRLLHTYTDPYMRVADRWFLRMIKDSISSA